jgi:Predicted ATP-dependent serine protease
MKSFDVENEVTEPQVPTFDRVLDLAINPVPAADDLEYEGKTVLIIPVDDPAGTATATEAAHAVFTVADAVYIAKLGSILEEVYRGVGNTYTPGSGGSSNSLMMLDYTKGSELKKETWWALYGEKIKRTAVKIESVAEGPFREATSFLPRNEPPTVPATAAVPDVDEYEAPADGENSFTADMNRAMNKPGTGLEAAKKQYKGYSMATYSKVIAEDIKWLVPRMIPQGMLTLIAGMPGVGKSWLTCDVAARLSRGDGIPYFGGVVAEPCDVLIINAEDGASQVRQRLKSAGADLDRVHFLACEQEDGTLRTESFSLAEADKLDATLEENSGIRMVVIDPVSAYQDDLNENSNSEMRSVLGRLTEIAGRRNVSIVLITHVRKAGASGAVGSAVDAAMGSRSTLP